ncbi:MAG: hypothetical protein R2860_13550 [Desulfobacterales bacterium]
MPVDDFPSLCLCKKAGYVITICTQIDPGGSFVGNRHFDVISFHNLKEMLNEQGRPTGAGRRHHRNAFWLYIQAGADRLRSCLRNIRNNSEYVGKRLYTTDFMMVSLAHEKNR